MPDEETKAQAEPEKPKQEAKPSDADREVQSRLHRRTAEAEKKATAAERERDEVRGELDAARRELETVRELSQFGEDTDKQVKLLAERTSKLAKQEKQLQDHARVLSARLLSQSYGIPEKELEGYEDPKDMEIAALRWQLSHPPKVAEEQTPKASKAEEGAEPAKVDMGEAYVPAKSWKDMTDEEFAKESKKLEGEARSRTLKRQ